MRVIFSLLLIALIAHTAAGFWDEKKRERDADGNRAYANAISATINNAVGVFKQVNKAGEPIFKHVSGGDWGMRQITTAAHSANKALYKPSLFGSAVSGLGKVVWFGAAAMEAVNVAEAAGKDLVKGTIKNTVHASTKAAGSWTGAAYGASSGAALLSFIPGVGTLVGGIAGGIVGAYLGTVAGEIAADVVVGQT